MKASKLKLATFLFAAISLSSAVAFAKSAPCTETLKIAACLEKSDPDIYQLQKKVTAAYEARFSKLSGHAQKLFEVKQKEWATLHGIECDKVGNDLEIEKHTNAVKTCLSERFITRISILSMNCETDAQNTVEEMAVWKKPWSKNIPRDFQVTQAIEAYVVSASDVGVNFYNLPSTTLPRARKTKGLLKNGHKILSLCKAQDRAGVIWLAYPLLDGSLAYVLQQDTRMLSYK